MLGIGRTYFENIRKHLINSGLLPRIHGNIKRMPQWKTKMVIDKMLQKFMDYQAQEVLTERIMENGHIEPFAKGTGNLGLTRSFGEELLFVFCSVCIH